VPDRHDDRYDPDPDFDRPSRAEAEYDAYLDEQEYEGPTCIICDGLNHNYIVGWHEVPGKGTQPIIAGPPCPLEDPGYYRPIEDEHDPF